MTFADIAQSTTDTAFDTFGIPATYEAVLSSKPDVWADPIDVTLLPTTRDGLVGGFNGTLAVTDEQLFEVRITELTKPVERSRVTIDGVVYRISSAPHRRDKRGLKWTFGCRKELS